MFKPRVAGACLLVCLVLHHPFVTAQLSISSGTSWVSTNNTFVVLDNTGLQYGASTASPLNIFKFTGGNDVDLGGPVLPSFYIIELAKSGAGKLTLLRDINITQGINFLGGLFFLNNYNVTLSPTALLNNENENSRFTGSNGGQITINTNLNAPTSANPGNLGAIITAPRNLGLVSISRGHVSQTNGSGNGSSILRYYDISPANNNNLDATLRLHYFDEELNGLTESGLVMWKSANNVSWTKPGFTSRSTTDNYVEKNAIGNFSRWTLSSENNALPVTGLKLDGAWRSNAVALSWTTEAEYDNDHFDLERRYEADMMFHKIAQVQSNHADGNSQTLSTYKYIDATASAGAGTILYRLKQVDKNGQFKYSNTVAVKPAAKDIFIVSVYPTPITGNSLFIQTGDLNIQKMQVTVFDMNGRLVTGKQLSYQSQLLPLQAISSGMYRLVIRSGQWEYSRVFVKQ